MAKQRKIQKIVDSWKVENSVYIYFEGEKKGTIRKKYPKPSLGYDVIIIDGITYGIKKIPGTDEYQIIQNINTVDKIKTEIEDKKIEIPKVEINENEIIKHEKYETIKTCIEANIPVFLVGPAGTGKNFTLEQIAKELGLEFYYTNSIQQEYKLTGFIDAGGNYHTTEFRKAFENGGIFFIDEIDASIPEVLVLINAAIANGYFTFPDKKINAHPNFRVVAAGNTVGNGADEQYTGRMVLDQATLDRFAIIEFDYDKRVELHITKGNIELVEFIRDIREQAKRNGIRATFSYRCLIMVTKLEGKLKLEEVLKIAVFKGLDKDTINTFSTYGGKNKYYEALRNLQVA